MVCLACGRWGTRLCEECRRGLRPAPEYRLGCGIVARAAFLHEATGRILVHRLKYQGITAVVPLLARAMAPLVPSDVGALVPVPRRTTRRLTYGVDQTAELARWVSRLTGIPVVWALAPPLSGRRHAGGSRRARSVPIFRVRNRPSDDVMLIDDVLTTGATVTGAYLALGKVKGVVTATAAPPVTSLIGRVKT